MVKKLVLVGHLFLQGRQVQIIQFLKQVFSAYSDAAETCNTAMEREFYYLSEEVFRNYEKKSYEAKFAFFWNFSPQAA